MIRLTTASGGVYEVDLDGHGVRKVQTTSESLVNSFPWIAYFRLLGRQDALDDFDEIDAPRVGQQIVFVCHRLDIPRVQTSFITDVQEVAA